MPHLSHHEKRRAPRATHDSVLEIHDPKGHLVTAIGRLVDVSAVGACFASTHALRVGDAIHGRLRLLKEGRLTISGHIVWIRKKTNHTLYGLAFDSVRRISS